MRGKRTSAVVRRGVHRAAPRAPVTGAAGVRAAHLHHERLAHVGDRDFGPRLPRWRLDLQGRPFSYWCGTNVKGALMLTLYRAKQK